MSYSKTVIRNAKRAEPVIRRCMAEGLTQLQTAHEVGASVASLQKWCAVLGIESPRKSPQPPTLTTGGKLVARNEEVLALRKEGKSLQEIGEHVGITKERVRQILQHEFPDVVIPRRAPLKEWTCTYCGRPRRRDTAFCSLSCKNLASEKKRVWNRDLAVRVMQLRAQQKTWEEVTQAIYPDMTMANFRARIQRYITTLFSTPEQEFYFKRNKP